MRANFLYLKILYTFLLLTLICFDSISGGVLNMSATRKVYNKIMKMHTLPFEDCGSLYDVNYVSISSCNTIPCQMKRGTTVMVNVIFDDNGNNISFLKHQVLWIFNAVRTNAAITPDPCDGDHSCLINESSGKAYYAHVYVNSGLPTIRGSMMWKSVDARQEEVICFKIPIVITS